MTKSYQQLEKLETHFGFSWLNLCQKKSARIAISLKQKYLPPTSWCARVAPVKALSSAAETLRGFKMANLNKNKSPKCLLHYTHFLTANSAAMCRRSHNFKTLSKIEITFCVSFCVKKLTEVDVLYNKR